MISLKTNKKVSKQLKFGVHTKYILKTMCGIINVDVNDIDFNEPDWQDKHRWTFANEVAFQNWLINYLQDNPSAIKELVVLDSMGGDKRWIHNVEQRVAKRFTLFYGWALESYESELNKITEQTIHKY
jgi:hypothetical protein